MSGTIPFYPSHGRVATAVHGEGGSDGITIHHTRASNLPVVAFAENGDILIKRANGVVAGSSWFSLYGTAPLDTAVANVAYRPSLALKGDTKPTVAWYEDDGTSFNVYVKKWDGAKWVALGGALDKTLSRDAKDVVLAVGTDNRPVVTWEEAGNIYVKRWDGIKWVLLGTTLDKVASHEALRPALAIGTDNNPVVTWQEAGNIYVKRWNGSGWVSVAGVVDRLYTVSWEYEKDPQAQRPAIVLKTDNNPIIAFDQGEFYWGSENIFVSQFVPGSAQAALKP